MLLCMLKKNFIILFFHEILQFKKSCNLIGQQHFGSWLETKSFSRYGVGGEISISILIFILDYFQEQLMIKFFKKSKNSYFGVILGLFCPNLRKNEFSWKKAPCQFLNIPIIYGGAKKHEKLSSYSWEKCRTDGETERQQWFCRTP